MMDDPILETHVRHIINEVKKRGDAALLEFTKKFDGVDLTNTGLKVTEREIEEAYDKVSGEQIDALQYLKGRIEEVESYKLKIMNFDVNGAGSKIHHILQPIPSVGCYVPGGEAAYPSTLLMTVVPAKVAGVSRIAVCSPPTFDGEINPLTLVATDVCGVDEVYRLGGAQAIAALAYGTESIKPVMKIVGPGRRIVTIAKTIVSHDVSIDIPAGPSEIVVLADEAANPRFVALDLISQSEHAKDNVAGLVTTSEELARKVSNQIKSLFKDMIRKEIVAQSLSNNGFILLCKNMDEAIDFINAFAPEHLEIMVKEPFEISKRIRSAGIILLGQYTPVTASDYGIGTNHVLPTAGFGHVYSGLSVLDFARRVNIVECSREGLRKMEKVARVLAQSEGLPNHFLALEERVKG